METLNEEIIKKIKTGNAILFTGAGFSLESTNIINENPPNSSDLSFEICKLGGFPGDNDLRYVSDYYIDHNNVCILIQYLKNTFSIKKVTNNQVDICKINWKRIYTTNYDNSVELAGKQNSVYIQSIDIDEKPDIFYRNERICIHLNGYIDKLNEININKSFKLSNSSYISSDEFNNSNWKYLFKKDLERSSAIIFVGYSLYDIEIQKLLYENNDFVDKTYFIIKENPEKKLEYTLSKFGKILPIGVNGFSEILRKNKSILEQEIESDFFDSIKKFELSSNIKEITDSMVESMLMHGDLDQEIVDNAVLGNQSRPHLIIRKQLGKILEIVKGKKNCIIFSELGNGKSVLVKELLPFLSINSINTYIATNSDSSCIDDIDKLSKYNTNLCLIVDGYMQSYDLIKHVSITKPSNVSLVISLRTNDYEKLRHDIKKYNFEAYEINVDYLVDDESSFFIDILDNVGLWGENASFSRDQKIRYLQSTNKMQLSLALLTLLKSPQIIRRIEDVVGKLIKNNAYRDTIFSICMLEVLDIEPTCSIVSEVSSNDLVYQSSLREDENFKQLFKFKGSKILSKSSLFCLSLIRNHFDSNYTMDMLHAISAKFNKIQRNSRAEELIFKSTLKFSFIERLLSDSNKRNNLQKYYENLKIHVSWLMHDPHFWLQYGMARISFPDYTRAQQCFDQAYSLAKNKPDYYTYNIDTQQARLYILKSLSEINSSKSYELFYKAHKLLSPLENDMYKFKQVQLYRDFFDSKYSVISKRNKENFKVFCNKMYQDVLESERSGYINITEQKFLMKTKDCLSHVLNKI